MKKGKDLEKPNDLERTLEYDYFESLAADIEGPTTPYIIMCKFVATHIIGMIMIIIFNQNWNQT